MENIHVPIDKIEKFVFFQGNMDDYKSEEFKELSLEISNHIRECNECLDKVKTFQNIADKIKNLEQTILINENEYSDEMLKKDTKDISNLSSRTEVMIYLMGKCNFSLDICDEIIKFATTEERESIRAIFNRKGIYTAPEVFENDSIQMRIAKIFAKYLRKPNPNNLKEAKEITEGLEIDVVKGIIISLELDSSLEKDIIGDIYNKTEINNSVAKVFRRGVKSDAKNKKFLETLSIIHDVWVKNNANIFYKKNEDGAPENNERLFVPLYLLDWGEVKKYLIFFKLIYEGAGIEIDEDELKETFEVRQQEFLITNEIFSHKDLIQILRKGSKFYPILEDLEGANSNKIDKLLANKEIADDVAKQIESRLQIKSREILAVDIIKSQKEELNILYKIGTETDFKDEKKTPHINDIVSKREVLLSKTIGKPFPAFILDENVSFGKNKYQNEILDRFFYDDEYDKKLIEVLGEDELGIPRYSEIHNPKYDEKIKIDFGYGKDMKLMSGSIEVSIKDLLLVNLTPNRMGYEDKKISDKEQGVTTTEIKGIKTFFKKLFYKFKNKFDKLKLKR